MHLKKDEPDDPVCVRFLQEESENWQGVAFRDVHSAQPGVTYLTPDRD